MKILLSGYYGFGNAGDEALLFAISSYFQKNFKDAELTVFSANPTLSAELYRVRAVSRSKLSVLWNEILKCEVLISGGGNLLQDKTSFKSLLYYCAIIWLAKIFGKKAAFFGQGLGPFQRKISKFIAKHTLNRCDLIILRDNLSYELIYKLGANKNRVYVSADLTGLLDAPSKEEALRVLSMEGIRKADSPILAVSVRPLKAKNKEEVYKSIAEAADHFAGLGYQIIFLLFYPSEDMEASSRVISYMKNPSTIIFRQCAAHELLSVISQSDLLLGVRLHSLIFSALARVPAMGISYDPKIDGFMADVMLPYIKAENISGQKIISGLLELKDNRKKYSGQLETFAAQMKRRAENSFTLLSDYILPPKILNVLGVNVHVVDMFAAKLKIDDFVKSGRHYRVFTPNPEIIVNAQDDDKLKKVLNSADLAVPDGAAMVVLSRFFGGRFPERVTGIDLMVELLDMAEKLGHKVFFLGAKEEVLKQAVANIIKDYPELKIAGFHNGYFTDDAQVIAKIKEARPQILFVGLGAPRQEYWITDNLEKLPGMVAVTVGGSFDVISGLKKRAPEWIQRLNIEWLYRLLTEPARAGRQVALLRFLYLVWKNRR